MRHCLKNNLLFLMPKDRVMLRLLEMIRYYSLKIIQDYSKKMISKMIYNFKITHCFKICLLIIMKTFSIKIEKLMFKVLIYIEVRV